MTGRQGAKKKQTIRRIEQLAAAVPAVSSATVKTLPNDVLCREQQKSEK